MDIERKVKKLKVKCFRRQSNEDREHLFSPDKYLWRLRHTEVWPRGEMEMADCPHLMIIMIMRMIMIMIFIPLTVSPRMTRNSLMFQSGKWDSFMMVTWMSP